MLIMTDQDRTVIYAIGPSPEAAMAELIEATGECLDEPEYTPATPALIAQVESEGGEIAWGTIHDPQRGDFACTCIEEDDHHHGNEGYECLHPQRCTEEVAA